MSASGTYSITSAEGNVTICSVYYYLVKMTLKGLIKDIDQSEFDICSRCGIGS